MYWFGLVIELVYYVVLIVVGEKWCVYVGFVCCCIECVLCLL